MLSAENVALENRAIRLMLQIREKELNYITNKYTALGTQSALIGGFSLTSLTSLSFSHSISPSIRWLFFLFSSLSLSSSLSCILNATFVTVWGPGLALRGPRGSMAKAYYGMIREQRQIFGSFTLSLLFFALQCMVAFWVIDNGGEADGPSDFTTVEPYTYIATLMMFLGGLYAVHVLLRMHRRFHALSPDELDLRPSLPFVQEISGEKVIELDQSLFNKGGGKKGKGSGKKSKGRNPENFMEKLRRHSNGPRASENHNISGYLLKKSQNKGGMQYIHGDPWKKRYFVLSNSTLLYWTSQEEHTAGKPARNEKNPIRLGGYEVMVNPQDFEWGLMLESVGGTERDWELRCSNEELRLDWIKCLLKGSLMGGNRGSDIGEMEDIALAAMEDDGNLQN